MSDHYSFTLGGAGPTLDDDEQKPPVLGAQAVNSQQAWNAQAQAGAGQPALPQLPVLGARPQISDFFTEGQIRHNITGQMGAKPNTDIRSEADSGRDTRSGLTSESTWRSIFGAKKTPADVPFHTSSSGASSVAPKLGMHSVMAAQGYAANLLHSLNGTTI